MTKVASTKSSTPTLSVFPPYMCILIFILLRPWSLSDLMPVFLLSGVNPLPVLRVFILSL